MKAGRFLSFIVCVAGAVATVLALAQWPGMATAQSPAPQSVPQSVPQSPRQLAATPLPRARLPIVVGGVGLKNGGFEMGAVDWITQSVNANDPLIYFDDDLLQNTSPHSGDWAAWMGDRNNENATLRQIVVINGAAPYLIYWQMISSNEAGCTADTARVLVNNAVIAGSETGLCATTNTKPAWVRKSLNLSAYIGQSVSIDFNMKADAGLPSSWLLDDIALSPTP